MNHPIFECTLEQTVTITQDQLFIIVKAHLDKYMDLNVANLEILKAGDKYIIRANMCNENLVASIT